MQDTIFHKRKTMFRGWPVKSWLLQGIVFLLLSGIVLRPSWAQPQEYLLKAGFLEKFARFTDWPDQSLPENDKDPFIISIIGNSPFQGSLEKIYQHALIKGRPVKIQYIDTLDQIPGSHILFICKSEQYRLGSILKFANKHPILLIGDTQGFAEKGVHINLYITPNGTLHFEINPSTSRKAGLKIQIVLLEIAKIIGG